MEDMVFKKPPLPWWAGGLLLAAVQILAVTIRKPLGASTQYLILDTMALKSIAPEYIRNHPAVSVEKYQTLGYGFWLVIGIVLGSFIASLVMGKFKPRAVTAWSAASYKKPRTARFALCFAGGFLILLGARTAGGCTLSNFISGLAQLSLSSIAFTLPMLAAAILTAGLVYPNPPQTGAKEGAEK